MAIQNAVQSILQAMQSATGQPVSLGNLISGIQLPSTNTTTGTTQTTATPSGVTNVYGTGIDLQNAKNVLGATGQQYNFIDTGKPGFTAPNQFNASDVVLGGIGTVGGIAGNIGPASRLAGANAEETNQAIQNYGITQRSAPYVNQVQQAIQQAQSNRPVIPTYDPNQDITDINNMYQQQQQAAQARIQGQTQQGVENLQNQMQNTLPQYQTARNQVDVQYNQEARRANEALASQGNARAGKALTTQAILGAGRINQLGALSTQEQQFVNNVNFQINQLKQSGLTEENAQIKELEAQKTGALLQARQNNFDRQLQIFNIAENRSQQDLTNMINGIQFAYGVSKDTANEIFQNNQFNWQKAQTTADQIFRQAQFDWQKAQADIDNKFKERTITDQEKQTALDNAFREKQLAEQRASRLASAARSSSGGNGGITQAQVDNQMWQQFYKAVDQGVGDQWLTQHRNDILDSGSANANSILTSMNKYLDTKASQQPTTPTTPTDPNPPKKGLWDTIKSWF